MARGQKVKSYKVFHPIRTDTARILINKSKFIAQDTVQIWMDNAAGQGDGVESYSEPCTEVLGAKYARIS